MAICIFDDDMRVQFAFVVDNQPARRTTGVFFDTHGVAFDNILVADFPAHLRQDGDAVRVVWKLDETGSSCSDRIPAAIKQTHPYSPSHLVPHPLKR